MARRNKREQTGFRDFLQFNKYLRVIRLAKTPGLDEFTDVAKIAGLGVILVGFLGYMIFILMSLLPL